MIENNYFKVQDSFINDLPNLSGSAVKLYIFLRRAVNEKRADGNKVWWDYEGLHEKTGLSRETIKEAVIELVKNGWIEHINTRFNSSNEYFLADEKIANPNPELLQKVSTRRKRTTLSGAVVGKSDNQLSENPTTSSRKNGLPVVGKSDTNVNEINKNNLNVNESNKTNVENFPEDDSEEQLPSKEEVANAPFSFSEVGALGALTESKFDSTEDIPSESKENSLPSESKNEISGPGFQPVKLGESSRKFDELEPETQFQKDFLKMFELEKFLLLVHKKTLEKVEAKAVEKKVGLKELLDVSKSKSDPVEALDYLVWLSDLDIEYLWSPYEQLS